MIFPIGDTVKIDFVVINEDNDLVTGLVQGDFTIKIFNPTNVEVSIDPIIEELGSGNYRLSFVPDITGVWQGNVYHSDYFPWGKSKDILITENNINDEILRPKARIV